jgi:hypothetical protein
MSPLVPYTEKGANFPADSGDEGRPSAPEKPGFYDLSDEARRHEVRKAMGTYLETREDKLARINNLKAGVKRIIKKTYGEDVEETIVRQEIWNAINAGEIRLSKEGKLGLPRREIK